MYKETTIEARNELIEVCNGLGSPAFVFSGNVRYLLSKYKPTGKDLKGVFKHLNVSRFTLNAIQNGRLNSYNISYVCIMVEYFNRKYNAGLSFVDMFVDLEARDRMKDF